MPPSNSSILRDQFLTPKTIIIFWLPLAATWLMMGLEGPYIAAIVARSADAAPNLAAFGVAASLSWLIESPIMMLLSASNALVRDRASYLALRRFTLILNGIVTAAMITLALPAVFPFVGERLIGLPHEISRLAHISTAILIFWPAAIGYRRFYQGILVRHRMTRKIAWGTVLRLVAMSITAGILVMTVNIPGALIGAAALLAGVVAEAVASRWMARHVIRQTMASDEVAEGTVLSMRDIGRFYFPLALTSILSMALGPLVTFGLGRGQAPIESLAVWPVINSLVFLFRSGGVAYQEVGVALAGSDHAVVKRTAVRLATFTSIAFAIVALTPLQRVWFEDVTGMTRDLARYATIPVAIMLLMPALEYVMSLQRARWIVTHRTSAITLATAIEAGVLGVTLFIAVGVVDMVGATGGAIAVITGRIAANTFLYLLARRQSASIGATVRTHG